jgi:hypothetical protein
MGRLFLGLVIAFEAIQLCSRDYLLRKVFVLKLAGLPFFLLDLAPV